MPVFFYVDEKFSEDPRCERVDKLVLSYTFFESLDEFDAEKHRPTYNSSPYNNK
jgi:cytochrome c oxidase assembly protein Cox11